MWPGSTFQWACTSAAPTAYIIVFVRWERRGWSWLSLCCAWSQRVELRNPNRRHHAGNLKVWKWFLVIWPLTTEVVFLKLGVNNDLFVYTVNLCVQQYRLVPRLAQTWLRCWTTGNLLLWPKWKTCWSMTTLQSFLNITGELYQLLIKLDVHSNDSRQSKC